MKIIVLGNQHEEIFEPEELDYGGLLQRISLTNEIRNRDNPDDQCQVIQVKEWPLPEPSPE